MSESLPELYIYEEVMLLALRDEKGTIVSGSWHQQALAGAILAELLLARRVSIEDGNKKFINLENAMPTGDALLDEALERIAHAGRRAVIQTWVSRIARIKNLKHRAVAGLCERGILRADEKTVLLIFTRRVYPEIDPAPERALIERMRVAIFDDTADVDPRTVVLISLAQASGLLRIPFDRKDLKKRTRRIEQITRGELIGQATREMVAATQAAVIAASAASVACVTTVTH